MSLLMSLGIVDFSGWAMSLLEGTFKIEFSMYRSGSSSSSFGTSFDA